jgi:hypothetical protein
VIAIKIIAWSVAAIWAAWVIANGTLLGLALFVAVSLVPIGLGWAGAPMPVCLGGVILAYVVAVLYYSRRKGSL